VKEEPSFGRSPRGRSRLAGRALLQYCPSHRRCASRHVVPAGTNMGRMQHYFPEIRGPRCALATNYETNPSNARLRTPHRGPDSWGMGARELRNEPKGPSLRMPRAVPIVGVGARKNYETNPRAPPSECRVAVLIVGVRRSQKITKRTQGPPASDSGMPETTEVFALSFRSVYGISETGLSRRNLQAGAGARADLSLAQLVMRRLPIASCEARSGLRCA